MDRLTTIASFDSEHEGQIVRSKLEAYGIPAFLLGGHDPYSTILPTHKFRLQVATDDADKARALISDVTQDTEPEPGFDACPKCESLDLDIRTLPTKSVYALSQLFAPLLALIGLRRNKCRCNSCEHVWRR